ncbi:LAMI_0A06260g1_1 [Lachancea mirantina]|uniref:LAMI_0A06260g1_1 n=1 Tax=Lachancea mirantina TaxID=1230905 RepID=A0A1G4IQ26_9SACH|nr:LAMI_0A06260g1_1 [Lachancea mirantina]
MVFTGGKSSKAPALFDIRIKSTDHDVIVVKGAPHEASSVLLSGTIVLSVLEPMQIKKLNLRLYGMLRLNVMTTYRGPKGPTQRNLKYDKRFFEHVWDNINIQDYFRNLYDNYSSSRPIPSKSNSSSALSGLQHKAKSTTSLMSLSGGSSNNSHILVQGNYEFPFSAILPGSVTESVEGLPNASVIYKLQATIERSKFATDLICKKHLRVVRTLTPDAVELSETMSVDNTWPNKVDYSISIPGKAIAIGSAAQIHVMIVPLLKGLKLGPIKVSLIEYSSYCAPFGAPTSQERIVNKMKLSDPLNHSASGANFEDSETFQDKWEVETLFSIPPSLSKCTQDCNILANIKVRHKLKFVISLINPDGHISELRASLPVQLFISPFVALGVKATDSLDSSANVSGHSSEAEPDEDDDMIFTNSELDLTQLSRIGDGNAGNVSSASLLAPPNYENHIYDRLWSGIAVEDTPVNSGRQSPVASGAEPMTDQQHIDALHQGLQMLSVEQGSAGNETESNGRPESGHTISPGNIRCASTTAASDYFTIPIQRNAHSLLSIPGGLKSPTPMLSPGIDHMSRVNSFGPQGSPSSRADWKINTMSHVPSYENAMRGDSLPVDLPPAYPDQNGDERNVELEKPKLVHQKSSLLNRVGSTSQLSHAALSRSNNSSSSSLQKLGLSRNNTGGSNVSLNISPSNSGKGGTASKHFGFGMTPLAQRNSPTELTEQGDEDLGSNQGSKKELDTFGRSSSFASLKGLLHRKDKSRT